MLQNPLDTMCCVNSCCLACKPEHLKGNNDSVFTFIVAILLERRKKKKGAHPHEKPLECIQSVHTGSFNEGNKPDPGAYVCMLSDL